MEPQVKLVCLWDSGSNLSGWLYHLSETLFQMLNVCECFMCLTIVILAGSLAYLGLTTQVYV